MVDTAPIKADAQKLRSAFVTVWAQHTWPMAVMGVGSFLIGLVAAKLL